MFWGKQLEGQTSMKLVLFWQKVDGVKREEKQTARERSLVTGCT